MRVQQLINQYEQGNCLIVIDELLNELNPTDLAYFMHLIPPEEHGKVLRLLENRNEPTGPEVYE